MEKVEDLFSRPIPQIPEWNWDAVRRISIEDNGEDLVPISLLPEKILVRSEYFVQGLRGAMPECFLRRGVFLKLAEASEKLPSGYRFVVFDGWRSPFLQKNLFHILKEEIAGAYPDIPEEDLKSRVCQYVALPSVGQDSPSPHITGGSVDLSIVNEKGLLLNMGSGFDDTSILSQTAYFEKLAGKHRELSRDENEILRNRRFLFNLMTGVGFTNYSDEWWHYDYGNQNWAWVINMDSPAMYGKIYPEMRWKRDFQ